MNITALFIAFGCGALALIAANSIRVMLFSTWRTSDPTPGRVLIDAVAEIALAGVALMSAIVAVHEAWRILP